MHNFKELKVWQNAMLLTKAIYVTTDRFPEKERFGLTAQIRRSAVSIPSNIAEGSGRGTDKDFVHFLHISFGSACELETQIIIANELTYISYLQTEELNEQIHEIKRMLIGLKKKLKANNEKSANSLSEKHK